MDIRPATHPDQVRGSTNDDLRRHFLVPDLFGVDEVKTAYSQHDRMVIGGVAPASGTVVELPNPSELASAYFLERREVGIINIGTGPGTVTAAGTSYELGERECLYLGRGTENVTFSSAGEAAFYLASTPAHATHPAAKATLEDAAPVHLGSIEGSNERTIYKYIHADGVPSCQLLLGVTMLDPGNMWNTMPAHVHERRTEIYLYFGLPADDRVVHLLGEPGETRHLFVADRQAVISPPWSIHCGFGTHGYAFVWAMGGENQDYTDVQPYPITELR